MNVPLHSKNIDFCEITWSAKSFDFLEVEHITAIIHLDYDESSRHCWAWDVYQVLVHISQHLLT